MSRLARFAKRDQTGIKQGTVRIPLDLYVDFEKIFDQYNMSFNEAIVNLIQAEVDEVKQEKIQNRNKKESTNVPRETSKKETKKPSKKQAKKEIKKESNDESKKEDKSE